MKPSQAIAIAIRCIEHEIQRLAIDANMHDTYNYVVPRTIAASKERTKLRAAIAELQQPAQARLL